MKEKGEEREIIKNRATRDEGGESPRARAIELRDRITLRGGEATPSSPLLRRVHLCLFFPPRARASRPALAVVSVHYRLPPIKTHARTGDARTNSASRRIKVPAVHPATLDDFPDRQI